MENCVLKIKKNNKYLPAQTGYAILELLFYISFFALFSLIVINSMITMTKSFKETSVQRELIQGGVIMERMAREIRQASAITAINANDLTLNTTDIISGANKTVRFLFSGSSVEFFENAALVGNLNPPHIVVTDLTFTEITTGNGEAVKINLTVRSVSDTLNRAVDFNNTIVLRGGYTE